MEKLEELILHLILGLDNKVCSYDILTEEIKVVRKIRGQKISYKIRRKKE